jgi:hypothetical protein
MHGWSNVTTPQEHASPTTQVPRHRAPNGRKLSDVLLALSQGDGERITLDELVHALQDRASSALMLVFAAPNILPWPVPGVSVLLGIPLIFLALQFMRGIYKPWLPPWLGRRSMARKDFRDMLQRLHPWLVRLERALRPRLLALTSPGSERLLGGVCLVLAIVLFLPLPLGNILPGLALTCLTMGMLERDGLAILVGLVLATCGLVIIGFALYAVIKMLVYFLHQAMQA